MAGRQLLTALAGTGPTENGRAGTVCAATDAAESDAAESDPAGTDSAGTGPWGNDCAGNALIAVRRLREMRSFASGKRAVLLPLRRTDSR